MHKVLDDTLPANHWARPMVAKVAPVIDGISNAIDFITPRALQLIATLDKAYDQIQPYSPELLAPMLLVFNSFLSPPC